MRVCELRLKEVINICNCRRLGCVADVDIDVCSGRIIALIVPGPPKIAGFFGRDMEYIILWNQVRQIGPDIILVEINEEEAFQKCAF